MVVADVHSLWIREYLKNANGTVGRGALANLAMPAPHYKISVFQTNLLGDAKMANHPQHKGRD